MCPPGRRTFEEYAAKAVGFKEGIIVQSVGDVEDSFDVEAMQRIEREHKKRFQRLAAALGSFYPRILALGAGSCDLCGILHLP
jgi:hypothetical protein